MTGSVNYGVMFLGLLFFCPCTASASEERLDNLELKVSRLDFLTQTKYLELKRKINNLNVLGGNSGVQGANTSTVEEQLESYDKKIDTFVDEQSQRTDVIARSISEEKVITREIMTIIKDLSESNELSVLEIEENIQLSENEREQFKTDWSKFQDKMMQEIKKLNTKVDDLQNTLANFDGNIIFKVGEKKQGCDDGWVLKNGVCYFYNQEALPWFGASIICSDLGGKLAEPHSDDEYNGVMDLKKGTDELWLGGSDMGHEGTWLWEYTQTPVELDHWESSQPNNLRGNQDCLEIGVFSKLNDEACDIDNKFLCEKPPNQ